MKQLAVISGKGGSGKTTLTAAFASLAKNAVLADCDVDAADMPLILKPELLKGEDYFGLSSASINPELCTKCGRCREVCRYGAISENFMINKYSCEGCAVCTVACPENAVILETRFSGQVVSSKTRFGPMVSGVLGIGEDASGKLVTLVRKRAQELAESNSLDPVIIDGPPGVGCPVIAAIAGTDLVLLVCEPTVSGLHDLKRVIELTAHFRVPSVVCINKCDINEEKSLGIEEFCTESGIPVLGRLPYDDIATKAMLQEETVIEYAVLEGSSNAREFADSIRKIWAQLEARLFEVPVKETGAKTLEIK